MAIKAIELLKGSGNHEEIFEVLAAVAASLGDIIEDVNTLQVKPLKGAMTNEVFEVNWPTKSDGHQRRVLVRLYGEGVEVFFNRVDEIQTFECMSKHGQGPGLLGRFTTGRVEEFIHAKTLSAADLRDPEISALIASKMREFHNLHMPGAKKAQLWQRMRKWLSHAKSLCSPKETKNFGLDNLDAEINMLVELLSQGYQEIGFCHNDLQYGNIMMDEDTRAITLIDYEYASYNPIAYDLANHFCEMVANYHSDEPHVLDYSKYPGLEERQRVGTMQAPPYLFNFNVDVILRIVLLSKDNSLKLSIMLEKLKSYLLNDASEFHTRLPILIRNLCTGKKPSNSEVDQLVNLAEKYTLANHLFWGLWGLISSHVNTIDFDYKEYARQRFQQYWLKKPTLLDSSSIISQDGIANGVNH